MLELFLGLIFALGIPHCWCTCIAWKPSSTPPARPAWRGGCQRFSPCRTLTVKATKNLPRMTRSALTNLNSPSSCSCVRHRRCVGSMQRGLRCSWKLPVFQVLVIKSSSVTAVSKSHFLRCCYTCMVTCTSCPSGTSGRELGCEEAIETILGLRSESHK